MTNRHATNCSRYSGGRYRPAGRSSEVGQASAYRRSALKLRGSTSSSSTTAVGIGWLAGVRWPVSCRMVTRMRSCWRWARRSSKLWIACQCSLVSAPPIRSDRFHDSST